MARLRWVCVSDLHLGALNSVLTSVTPDGMDVDRTSMSPVMPALADCLRSLPRSGDEPPELVVLGDLFELALTTTDVAAASFGQFISTLRIGTPDGAVARNIRFLPGNHDHRLWTRARDAHYLQALGQLAGDDAKLPEARHVTELFPENESLPVRDSFVELLAARADPDAKVVVEQSYPNLGMITPDGRKAVVLSHGHFVEPLYRLMSNLDSAFGLARTEQAAQASHLEADNGGWIDFFWSSMGDSGDITGIVRNLYESLQSREAMNAEIDQIRRFIARRHRGPRGFAEARLVSGVLRREVALRLQRERHRKDVTLSPGANEGLAAFLAGPVRTQLGPLDPGEVTFVFGHTHKPFVEARSVPGYGSPVSVVNTGGWVVDSVEPDERKGAAVIVVDEDAHVAVIRCYTEGPDQTTYQVSVVDGDAGARDSTHGGTLPPNPLVEQLASSIDPSRDPWRALGEAVSTTVAARAGQLDARIAAAAASDKPAKALTV